MKSNSYVDYACDLLSPFGRITAKAMFGGYGIYLNNVIIGIIANDELYFKVDDSNKTQYEELYSTPFTYKAKGKRAVMSYWRVPEEILEDKDNLQKWVMQSYDISKRLKKK